MLPKEMSNYVFYGLDSETGDGYRMATAIGADTINMDLVEIYPQGGGAVPGSGLAATASSTDTMKKSGAIYVNRDGRRYVNERASLGDFADTTVTPDHIAYMVIDAKAWKEYVANLTEDKLISRRSCADEVDEDRQQRLIPVMTGADTLSEAAAVGVERQGAEATVRGLEQDG